MELTFNMLYDRSIIYINYLIAKIMKQSYVTERTDRTRRAFVLYMFILDSRPGARTSRNESLLYIIRREQRRTYTIDSRNKEMSVGRSFGTSTLALKMLATIYRAPPVPLTCHSSYVAVPPQRVRDVLYPGKAASDRDDLANGSLRPARPRRV